MFEAQKQKTSAHILADSLSHFFLLLKCVFYNYYLLLLLKKSR